MSADAGLPVVMMSNQLAYGKKWNLKNYRNCAPIIMVSFSNVNFISFRQFPHLRFSEILVYRMIRYRDYPYLS